MIAGIFHEGSGLGNQLHRYVATRVRATEVGCRFGMANPHLFKGSSFMNLDMGKSYDESAGCKNTFTEKKVVENGVDIRGYDPEFNFIEDNTLIDGEFQDERYFNEHIDDIREWLKVEPLDMPDDLCVIGFRGGEYTVFPDLFLTKDYWEKAIGTMRKINPNMQFEIHTDDPHTAQDFFSALNMTPLYTGRIIHDIGLNWRSIRYAEHLIIANSSFYILPSLLNENVKEVIAPRYWARHNTGTWALPSNFYQKFTYIV